MINVLITSTSFQDQPGEHLKKIFSDSRLKVDCLRGPLTKEQLRPHITKYDAILCGDDEYDAEMLGLAQGRLKLLSKYGVGLDRIDLKAAEKLGIKVRSCVGVNSATVAEHVFALLLAHAKNIEASIKIVRAHQWERPIGYDLGSKNLLLVGLGNIGKEVAVRAKAFGMEVGAFDPVAKATEGVNIFSDLAEGYRWADIVSLHCPLNDKTRHMINAALLAQKKEVVLINTARGGLVNEADILAGLKNQNLLAYLADVLEEEPINPQSQLPLSTQVLITPHIASRTSDNILKQAAMALDNLYKELGLEA